MNVKLVFKRYNKLNDGIFKYSEFIHAVAPLQQEHAKPLFDRKPKINKSSSFYDIFSQETIQQFLKVLNLIIVLEEQSENMRQRLNERKKFSIQLAFKTIIYLAN